MILSEYNAALHVLAEKTAKSQATLVQKVIKKLHDAAKDLPSEKAKKLANYGVKMANSVYQLSCVHKNFSGEISNQISGNTTKALEGLPLGQEIQAKLPERAPKNAAKKEVATQDTPKPPKAKRSPKQPKGPKQKA